MACTSKFLRKVALAAVLAALPGFAAAQSYPSQPVNRLRWLIGAEDLKQARERIKAFTLEERADKIECPMLVGYCYDDRIMDPRGALKLYENAVNSKRQMLDGVGHGDKIFERKTYIADWFMKQLGAA